MPRRIKCQQQIGNDLDLTRRPDRHGDGKTVAVPLAMHGNFIGAAVHLTPTADSPDLSHFEL